MGLTENQYKAMCLEKEMMDITEERETLLYRQGVLNRQAALGQIDRIKYREETEQIVHLLCDADKKYMKKLGACENLRSKYGI